MLRVPVNSIIEDCIRQCVVVEDLNLVVIVFLRPAVTIDSRNGFVLHTGNQCCQGYRQH